MFALSRITSRYTSQISKRTLSSIPKNTKLNTHILSNNTDTPKLVFTVKDHATLQNVITAIESRNYTIITPSGRGSTNTPSTTRDIFLL